MLLTDDEVQERLESPLNLLNRLRNASTAKPNAGPCLPPTTKDIDFDVDAKLAVSKLKENAAEIMALSLHQLKGRIPDIQKPETLARVAGEMNKVLQSRPEDDGRKSMIVVYAPSVIQENHFPEIHLQEET